MSTRICTSQFASLAQLIAVGIAVASACNEADAAAPQADFNGDGRADLAIGVPNELVGGQAGAGGVAVVYGRPIGLNQAGDQFWTADVPGINSIPSPGAGFGTALAAGDFDGDGFSDLAIGIPFQFTSTALGAGMVQVIYGTATGLTSADSLVFTRDSAGMLGDPTVGANFGGSLVAGDFDGDGYDDLAIGVINQDIGTAEAAGEVHILYGRPAGLRQAGNQIFNQDTLGIEGEPETEDGFGLALSAGDFDGDGRDDLAIGIPNETVDAVRAGAVEVLYGSADGLSVDGAQFIAQGLDGLQNTPERSDGFGAALTAGDFDHDGRDDLAISVLQENVGGIEKAGAAHVLYGTDAGLDTVHDQFWSQDTPGVKDDAEFEDFFGWSMVAADFNNDEFDDLAIAAAVETIDDVVAAGAVNVLYGGGNGLKVAGNQFWHQNSGTILDEAEAQDFFGLNMTAGDYDNDGCDDLAVAVALEGINNVEQAGAVNVIYGTAGGLRQIGNQFWHQDAQGIIGSAQQSDRFGLAVR